jgi:sugar phosphate permease
LVLTAPGQTLLVSLLNLPLREAFELDAFALNTAYTVATVTAALPLVWVGRLIDRIGPRRTMALVALSFGAACVFMASVVNVAMVFAGFFLLRFLGQGALSLAAGHALAMWFHQRLGRLEGIRTVALFAAWALLPAVTQGLIDAIGWRATWASFGLFVALTIAVLALRFLHDRPEDVGLALDGVTLDDQHARSASEPGFSLRDAIRTRAYWLLAFAAAIPPMVGTAMMFDLQPLLGARELGAGAAARAIGAWSATMAVLAIPTGQLVDRARPGPLLALGTLTVGISSVLLIGVASEVAAVCTVAVMALGQSLVMPTVAATTARFFGRRHHGAIRSSLARIGVLAAGLGPLAFGVSQWWTGGYAAALVGFALCCLPIAAAAVWLRAPPASAPGIDESRSSST